MQRVLNMNKNLFKFVSLCIFFICIFSCVSNNNENLQIEKKEYTTEEFIENKIKQIDNILETDSLKAFWYSYLLYEEYKLENSVIKNFEKNLDNSIKDLQKLYSEQKWMEFCNNFESINKILAKKS